MPHAVTVVLANVTVTITNVVVRMMLGGHFMRPSVINTARDTTLNLLIIDLLFPTDTLVIGVNITAVTTIFNVVLFVLLVRHVPPASFLVVPLVNVIFNNVVRTIAAFVTCRARSLRVLDI